jgi:hypothetical protein
MKTLSMSVLIILTIFLNPACVTVDNNDISLKKALISATVKAIEIEIKGYEGRFTTAESGVGPEGNVEKFKKTISDLKIDLEKFKTMKAAAYPDARESVEHKIDLDMLNKIGPVLPPMKKALTITVKQAYITGSLLDLDGMLRSGPFYHISGIKGDDFSVLTAGKHYQLDIYLVYKREYFGLIPNYYVYVEGFKKID